MEYSYQFTHAIVRQPAKSIIKGLRAVDIGSPDYDQMICDHNDYVEALISAGVEVINLTALDKFPDGQFVEDTALCLPKAVILMRPGAPSRLGEVNEIAPKLRELFEDVYEIDNPGHIEGGDILVTGKEILVGRSARTDENGVRQLSEIVTPLGYVIREVFTPPEIYISRQIVRYLVLMKFYQPSGCRPLAVLMDIKLSMLQMEKKPLQMQFV